MCTNQEQQSFPGEIALKTLLENMDVSEDRLQYPIPSTLQASYCGWASEILHHLVWWRNPNKILGCRWPTIFFGWSRMSPYGHQLRVRFLRTPNPRSNGACVLRREWVRDSSISLVSCHHPSNPQQPNAPVSYWWNVVFQPSLLALEIKIQLLSSEDEIIKSKANGPFFGTSWPMGATYH